MRKLFPSVFPVTEYVTSSADGLPCMLKCVAVVGGKQIHFEKQPMFLGYKPLVMAVCDVPEIIQFMPESRQVTFEYLNKISGEKVASLELRADQIIPLENKLLILFVGISGTHYLESRWDRFAFWLNGKLTRKSAGNIDLTPTEYDQLKIAYCIPRDIKIAYLMKEGRQTHFPIDLFGYIGTNQFLLSLRHSKKSCMQILESQCTFICPGRAEDARQIYSWGRNHSSDMHAMMRSESGVWLPGLPDIGLGCETLTDPTTLCDYGEHRLILFNIKDSDPGDRHLKLVHVHRSYANWHKRQGFPLKEIPH